MTTRTSNLSGFAALAEATTIDISLIGTKRDGGSLQLELPPKRLRNDDEERCDAIDTISSAIIAHAGLADDAVFRTVTVTGREPAITEVTKFLSDAIEQFTEPANTLTLTREEEINCKRVLREVLVAFNQICGGRCLSHNYWQTVAQPTPTDLMQHLLSAPHRSRFIAFAGGDERKLQEMISLYDHPTLFSAFSRDVHTVTVKEAIDAVEAWGRIRGQGARTLRNMLAFQLNVRVLWQVQTTDLGKELHEHVQAMNERRHNSIDIENIARAFNESCKQQWIRDAEEAKLLVTYDKYQAKVAELEAKDRELATSIQTLIDRDTAFTTELETATSRISELETVNSKLTAGNTKLATELATTNETVKTVREQNTALATELATTNETVKTLREQNTALATELATTNETVKTLREQNTALATELATTKDCVKTLTKTVTALSEKVDELLSRDKSAV
ncbi:hypothetical protein FN846DRAFT_1022603 [Sphaerosporella brunnea]|uniref:Uncharacterized protein n=1 Tax=Sphaerosporella brunnea TaxID=1250544 RepID=A0A5J5ESC8_9PEZI|nr:hypothetical protein FN846DRAFT_1022603 [Sphaerosporella brunnea]